MAAKKRKIYSYVPAAPSVGRLLAVRPNAAATAHRRARSASRRSVIAGLTVAVRDW